MSKLPLVLIAGAIAFPPAGAAAQQAPVPRTLASFTGDSIEDLRVSPNGRFILLATKSKLSVQDLASHQTADLANVSASAITWSPKGDRIAWTQGDEASNANVWTMPVDAATGRARGAPQRLTTGRSATSFFSADGQWIGYMSFGLLGRPGLSIVPATGGPDRVVARGFMFEGMEWSADGKSVFVNGEAPTPAKFGVLKLSVDGKSKVVLPTPPGELMIGATADQRYLILTPRGVGDWVRAGDQATVVDTAGRVVGHVPLPNGRVSGWPGVLGDSALLWMTVSNDQSVLEVRPVRGGTAKRLPLVGESAHLPVWSPDGQRIAFQTRVAGRNVLAIMNADGTKPQLFRESEVQEHPWSIAWSPDSRLVAFKSPDFRKLSLLDVANGTIRTALQDSIGHFHWRADGQAIVWRSRGAADAGIHEITLTGQRRQLLTWPMGTPAAWQWVGDSSIFVREGKVESLRRLGPERERRIGNAPAETELLFPVISKDHQLAVGLLAHHESNRRLFNQVEVLSLGKGDRKVLDLPFSWRLPLGADVVPELSPSDSSLLVPGARNGESRLSLYRVPLNGAPPTVVADLGEPSAADRVSAASVSPDGRSVVYAVRPTTPVHSIVMIDLRGAIPGSSRPVRH